MVYWFSMIAFWIYFTFLYPTKVIGKKNMNKGKCIWACNHTTNADGLILGTKHFCRFYALGKKELFKHKLLGWYLKTLGLIPVNRGASDIKAVKDCLRVLKDKQKPLLIFPSGTRESTPEEVQDLKNGVAMFALKANCPIIPMVFVRKPKLFRRNRFVIGEPIDVSMYEGQKASKEIYDEINEKITKSMEEMLAKYSYKSKKNAISSIKKRTENDKPFQSKQAQIYGFSFRDFLGTLTKKSTALRRRLKTRFIRR